MRDEDTSLEIKADRLPYLLTQHANDLDRFLVAGQWNVRVR